VAPVRGQPLRLASAGLPHRSLQGDSRPRGPLSRTAPRQRGPGGQRPPSRLAGLLREPRLRGPKVPRRELRLRWLQLRPPAPRPSRGAARHRLRHRPAGHPHLPPARLRPPGHGPPQPRELGLLRECGVLSLRSGPRPPVAGCRRTASRRRRRPVQAGLQDLQQQALSADRHGAGAGSRPGGRLSHGPVAGVGHFLRGREAGELRLLWADLGGNHGSRRLPAAFRLVGAAPRRIQPGPVRQPRGGRSGGGGGARGGPGEAHGDLRASAEDLGPRPALREPLVAGQRGRGQARTGGDLFAAGRRFRLPFRRPVEEGASFMVCSPAPWPASRSNGGLPSRPASFPARRGNLSSQMHDGRPCGRPSLGHFRRG
jgi:hypothetical protein